MTKWQERLHELLSETEDHYETGKVWTERDIKTKYPTDDIAHIGYNAEISRECDNHDPMYGDPYPKLLRNAVSNHNKSIKSHQVIYLRKKKTTTKPKRKTCRCKK